MNPYDVTSVEAPLLPDTRQLSTWLYNGRAITVSTTVNGVVFLLMALSGSGNLPEFLIGIVVVSFVCASWANIGLGPKIGWDRGGLPVVLVVISAATLFYSLSALVIGGCIYTCVGLALSN